MTRMKNTSAEQTHFSSLLISAFSTTTLPEIYQHILSPKCLFHEYYSNDALLSLSLFFFPQLYWYIIDIWHCVSLRYMCCFDTFINDVTKMIITIVPATTSISSHSSHFFFVLRTFQICSLSNIKVFGTFKYLVHIKVLLATITMPPIRSLNSFYTVFHHSW